MAGYWDLMPAIVGGVFGAFAGGLPSWALAKRQSNETLRRDATQRIETQKALAFSTTVKLLHIINSTISLNNHVKSCMDVRNDPNCAHMEPWQVLIPMIGHTDEDAMRFSAEEMAVFASAGEYDFMQDMMLLAVRHASTLASFQEYCRMRNEFRETGPKPEAFNGQIGSAMVSRQEADSFKPYTIPLNSVALGLDAGLDVDVLLARSVATNFDTVTSRYFKVDRFAALTFPTDEELSAMRLPRDPSA